MARSCNLESQHYVHRNWKKKKLNPVLGGKKNYTAAKISETQAKSPIQKLNKKKSVFENRTQN